MTAPAPHRPRRGALVATVVAALLAAALAPALARDDVEAEITRRIQAETDCVVDYLSQVQDRSELEPPSVRARVHCRDGTAYDVEWRPDVDDFRFETCRSGQQVC